MTYEDYCKIEGLEMTSVEKKAYEAGQHDVAHDIASCFAISTCIEDDCLRHITRNRKSFYE